MNAIRRDAVVAVPPRPEGESQRSQIIDEVPQDGVGTVPAMRQNQRGALCLDGCQGLPDLVAADAGDGQPLAGHELNHSFSQFIQSDNIG